MFNPSDMIKLDSGRRIRLDSVLTSGGQGTAYWASDLGSGQQGVFKAFHTPTRDTITRLRFLVSRRLGAVCPVLFPPIDLLTRNGSAGSYTPRALGQTLEEFLANYNATFIDGLQLAAAVARAISVLHESQFVHGDLHAANLTVHRNGSVLQPFLIDLDNFKAPGVPEPPCVGHELYMAPELRQALANHCPAVPEESAELYSLGVMMHEILLVRHPAAGADADPEQFRRAMCSGWIHDPATSNRSAAVVGGLPVEVLNANLMRLFRRSLSTTRNERTTAGEWVTELTRALHLVFICPNCGGPCLIDAAKTACPVCGASFPTLRLRGAFGEIVLRDASTVLGRSNVGASSKVSMNHAIIRRHGPEYWLESTGRNGTFRRANGTWIRLPDRQPVLIQSCDRLKLADVEARVTE